MSLARRITAFLLLFAWCFATGHLWVEHGGGHPGHSGGPIVAADGAEHHHSEPSDGDQSPCDDPASPVAHHHHDVGLAARDSGGIQFKTPMVAVLVLTLLVLEEGRGEAPVLPAISGSPPDERRSGYLFVVRTARPARGPSLVA